MDGRRESSTPFPLRDGLGMYAEFGREDVSGDEVRSSEISAAIVAGLARRNPTRKKSI